MTVAAEVQLLPMTADEARNLVDQIKVGMDNVRRMVHDLWKREGWVALGYDSWTACVTEEFDHSRGRLSQLLSAAKTEEALGLEVGSTPEWVLRPLAGRPPEVAREAYSRAVEAHPEGVTGRDVADAVVSVLQPTKPVRELPVIVRDILIKNPDQVLALEFRAEERKFRWRPSDPEKLAIFEQDARVALEFRAFREQLKDEEYPFLDPPCEGDPKMGPYKRYLRRLLLMADPEHWRECLKCKGSGKGIHNHSLLGIPCSKCNGSGYEIPLVTEIEEEV